MRKARIERIGDLLDKYESITYGFHTLTLLNDKKHSPMLKKLAERRSKIRNWLERKLYKLTKGD